MNETALATRPTTGLPSTQDWKTLLEMADVFVKSGLLPDAIKTPQAAVLVMQKGREMGIPPLYALSNIVVIKGKPAANAELMLAVIYRDHGDDAVRFTETTATACTITYKRRGWPERKSYSFTIQDATAANLMVNDTWKKYPAAMLRARCISAVARMAFPDSIGGMYTPEELGATVTVAESGETHVTALPEAEVRAPTVNAETGEIAEFAPPSKTITCASSDCGKVIEGPIKTKRGDMEPAEFVRLTKGLCPTCYAAQARNAAAAANTEQ